MLSIGALVDNKYKILSEIGHGGMSVVYLAINERANKTWAIKEVRKNGVVDFEAVKQGLIVETNMLKNLRHPHLPSIIDVLDFEDSFLIVMDYIEGRSLQSVLKHEGAQPEELVVEWGKQLCDVLGYLHSRQPPIIYRDMKPANVMLKPDGNVMLIDFGTAREFKNRAMVEDTTCLGTRGYAAPEQFGGYGQTDARTDIYCLGATLYHLLTGHSPAEPPYEIKPLRYWNPSYAGSGIEKLINKCCQQDPAARYQNCGELMYALEHIKDEDDAMIRARKRKLGVFMASAGIFIFGLLGTLGFGLASSNAAKQTYDVYLNEIEVAGSLENATLNCSRASALQPGDSRAYRALLDYLILDSSLDQDEKIAINQYIKPNLTRVRDASPTDYINLVYDIGFDCFFCSKIESIIDAEWYLQTVKDSENVEEIKRNVSEKLFNIVKWSRKNESGVSGSSTVLTHNGNTYSARQYWDDLAGIASDDMEDTLQNNLAIALYGRVAYLVYYNVRDFVKEGVTEREMNELFSTIQNGLDTLRQYEVSESGEESELLREALDNLDRARSEASTQYQQKR